MNQKNNELAHLFDQKIKNYASKTIYQQNQASIFLKSFNKRYMPNFSEQEVINFLNKEMSSIKNEATQCRLGKENMHKLIAERFNQVIKKAEQLNTIKSINNKLIIL